LLNVLFYAVEDLVDNDFINEHVKGAMDIDERQLREIANTTLAKL